jgi:hypothetical protein
MHQAGLLPLDDPVSREVLKAATKICKTLGELCAPFMPVILPRLLQSVSREIKVLGLVLVLVRVVGWGADGIVVCMTCSSRTRTSRRTQMLWLPPTNRRWYST